MNIYLPRHAGKCAKAEVIATLITSYGTQYQSSNFCLTPQKECPRDAAGYKSGEGYHLCKEVCTQPGHAEENVIFFAKKNAADVRNATIYVEYTWICNNCQKISAENQIKVQIGRPPERNQCDGCCTESPLRGNLHVGTDGKAFMGCQKHRYEGVRNV